jgi:hypothetical protein
MSNVEIIQHYLQYAAEGITKPLSAVGMKIHITQKPLNTTIKHSHPFLTPYNLRLNFYSTIPTFILMLYLST